MNRDISITDVDAIAEATHTLHRLQHVATSIQAGWCTGRPKVHLQPEALLRMAEMVKAKIHVRKAGKQRRLPWQAWFIHDGIEWSSSYSQTELSLISISAQGVAETVNKDGG